MASYLPPTENLPSFNPSVFDTGNDSLTYNEAKKLFLTFPNAQGTENLLDTNINGDLTVSNTYGDITVESTKFNVSLIDSLSLPNYKNTDSGLNVLIGNGIGFQMTGTTTESTIIGCNSCGNTNNAFPFDNNGLLNITAIGTNSLSYMYPDKVETNNNNAFGHSSGLNFIYGSHNTFIGDHILYDENETNGSYNTFLGSYSGSTITTVNNSTAIGANAKITDNHQIMLGTIDEYVQIPNYIKFPDGTTQDTAGGGGGGSGVDTSSTLTGAPYTSAGDGAGATIGGTFTGTGLTAYGVNALSSITSGTDNLAIGSNAGKEINDGTDNVVVGENTAIGIDSGSVNIVIGSNSGNSITSEMNNIIIGSYSDIAPLTNNNIIIGNGISSTYGSDTIQIGDSTQTQIIPNKLIFASDSINKEQSSALVSKNTGTNAPITASGINSVGNFGGTLSGTNLTAYGVDSLKVNTTGSYNCSIGNNSLKANTTGLYNSSIGESSGISLTTGNSNTFIGYNSGPSLTTGGNNTLIGASTDVSNSSIGNSTAIGFGAIATASNQIQLGTGTEYVNIPNYIRYNDGTTQQTGIQNSLLYGYLAIGTGTPNIPPSDSTALGINALHNHIENPGEYSRCTGIGNSSLYNMTTGINNTAIGYRSGYNLTTGTNNTFIGKSTGDNVIAGSNNTLLGHSANVLNSTIENSTSIGSGAIATETNQIMLGTSAQTTKIPGNLDVDGLSTFTDDILLKENKTVNIYNDYTSPTINYSSLQSSAINMIGSTTNITNSITPTNIIIEDSNNRGTFTTTALRLVTKLIGYNRNEITNTSMTITGTATSSTNTIVALANTITDGVRTIFTGISSNIATIKLTASASLGNAVSITPTSIGIFTTDGTTSYGASTITPSIISIVGANTNTNDYFKVQPNISGGSAVFAEIRSSGGTDFNTTAQSGVFGISTNNTVATGIVSAPSILLRRVSGAPVNGALGLLRFAGYSSANATTLEYGRITTFVKSITGLLNNGRMLFQTLVNSVVTDFLDFDGGEDQINAFKPIDMNNNSIVSSTGGITLDTSSSASGNPYITLTPKETTGYIILNNIQVLTENTPTNAIYRVGTTLHIKV